MYLKIHEICFVVVVRLARSFIFTNLMSGNTMLTFPVVAIDKQLINSLRLPKINFSLL